MSIAPTGWEDIFEPGEVLLWQGRPDPKIVWQKGHFLPAILGLSVAGLGILWIFFTPLGDGYASILGVFLLLLAAFLGIGPPVMSAMVRKATWYSLSNRRGFIAMNREQVGRKLSAYVIEPDFDIKFDGQDPATIMFAIEIRQPGSASYIAKISFDRIAEGQKVYDMMRSIQEGKA